MKFFISFILFFGLTLQGSLISLASGVISSVSPSYIGFDDLVKISGFELGNNPSTRQICINDYCINDKNIISWSNSAITFRFNTVGLDLNGDLSIRFIDIDGRVQSITSQSKVAIKPFIQSVTVNNENLALSEKNDVISVNGYYFGSKSGKISIGDQKNITPILWTDTQIQFNVPDIITSSNELIIESSIRGVTSFNKINFQKKYGNNKLSPYQIYLNQVNFNPYDDKKKYTGDGVVVAVIDDGVYWNHEDLQDSLFMKDSEIIGKNFANPADTQFTPSGEHGTAVSGIIGARDNTLGFIGIAPDVKIMPLNVSGTNGIIIQDIIDAIYFAVDNGADIINLSLGSVLDIQGYSDAYDDAILYGYKNDVVFVVAAGNGDGINGNGKNLNLFKTSPVCNDLGINAVIGVGAVGGNNEKTSFSNYGGCIDIWAPGENIALLSYKTSSYTTNSGTSFSAPQVTGAVALLKEKYPNMKPWEVIHYITRSAQKDASYPSEGILDIHALLSYSLYYKDLPIEPSLPSTPDITPVSTPIPTPVSEIISLKSSFSDVSSTYKYFSAIEFVKSKGIVNGYEDSTYKPEKTISRAEFTKILLEANTSEIGLAPFANFADVSSADWFSIYVNTAKQKGILNGYIDNTFKPNNEITHAESAKIIVNTFDLKPREEKIGEQWWVRFDEKLREKDLLPATIQSQGHKITRGEMSEIIYRLLK